MLRYIHVCNECYTGLPIKVPHEETFSFFNISHTCCLKNALYLISPICSSSNAFYSIKFEHPIPEIWSIY